MDQEIDFDDAEIKALRSWLQGRVSSMAQNVAKGSGHSIGIDIKSLALKEEGSAKDLIPSDAMTWGIKAGENEGVFMVVVPRDPALALGRPADEDEAALSERLVEESAFSDEEKTALAEIQNQFATALADNLKSTCSESLASNHLDFIEGSAWASGNDPIPSGSFVIAEADVTVGHAPKALGVIIISPELIKSCFAEALVAKERPAGCVSDGSDFLFFPASSGLKNTITSQLGATPKECETVAELMRGFLDDDTAGAIISVGQKETHILSLLRGIQELPDCDTKPIVIVLEEPTTTNVVRCGRLGLFKVLPPEFEANDFQNLLSRPE